METKTSMPSLLDLSSWPSINTSLWRAGFSGMGTSLPPPVHRWATPAQSGKSSAWPKGWVAVAYFPLVLFPSYEEHPCVFSTSAFLSSPFFKRLHLYCIYTVLPYEVCMNMCFSNSSKKRTPPPLFSLSVKRLLCYSPKNWFRLFKGLFFTALSPRVDARQAVLIFSEFEVIVLNWQTKHLSPLVFHFYH